MKIVTGVNWHGSPYWVNQYIAPAFKELGHDVYETGELNKSGFDLGFVVQNQRWVSPKKGNYPLGYLCSDCVYYFNQNVNKKYKMPYPLTRYDTIFVDGVDAVEKYGELGLNVVYLPLACDPKIHKGFPLEEIYDVGFIGRKTDRREIYIKMLRDAGLNVFCYWSGDKRYAIDKTRLLTWESACLLYSQCRIILNVCKDATNKRTFEGMSIGKLMLVDRRGSEPDNLFKDGKHLAIYNNEVDLVGKAIYYSRNKNERLQVAQAGQKLVHEKHKWTDRMRTVIECLTKKL